METTLKHSQKCLRCGAKIRNFTKDNGLWDWKKRKYHKKCWKEHLKWSALEISLNVHKEKHFGM